MVGFPGETRADFEATLDLMRQVQFDSLFAFMYSDRPKAPSTHLSDKVSAPEKCERLQELLVFVTCPHGNTDTIGQTEGCTVTDEDIPVFKTSAQ